METWDAITARRNVREFTDRPISDVNLDRILEAGRRAPSSKNWQPWDFVLVTDRRVLGELGRLTPAAAAAVERMLRQTAHNSTLRLNLFVSYGSRAELVRAARLLAEDAVSGRIAPEAIDDRAFSDKLFTSDCPDPDLLIRTSGEARISNFLLWQLAYTEILISPVLWPDFGRREFFEAILDYQRRDRRFGRVAV